jgi:hemoglobin
MKDIENRQDIEKLVKTFYDKAFADSKLGHIFVEIAKLNLAEHLPIIADFWEMILFQTVNFQQKYKRSPMQKHIELNEKIDLKREHFLQWLNLFFETIDENFSGEKADLAKARANAIANTMFLKVSSSNFVGVQVSRQ